MTSHRFRHKWWGWGTEDVTYDIDTRPGLPPFIRSKGLDVGEETTPRVARDSISLPPRRIHAAFEDALAGAVAPQRITRDDDDRLIHAFGRSYRDLVRLRAGEVARPPDLVVYPESHDEVVLVVELAATHGVTVIPFGGGTNVVGGVEPDVGDPRPVVTLDMRRMNRLLSVDEVAMTAVLEAGMFGPEVEEALNAHGLSLGHHPDSFIYSTLGGWIATRSAGTQSNAYGKIEDMVVGLAVVTPTGTVETKPLPAASNGPDLNRLLVGSEGVLGIITKATMRVHRMPETEEYRMLLFPTFQSGVEALHACMRAGYTPSLARISDESETELMFAAKHPTAGWRRWVEGPAKRWLGRKGYRRPAALIVGFEGPREPTAELRAGAMRILRRHGAFDLGKGPGESWKEARYDVPYLRDFMMDFGIIADSFETSVLWSGLMPLYREVTEAFEEAILAATGRPGYVGCHVSHLYETGACLYYTFAASPLDAPTTPVLLDGYGTIKRTVTEAIMARGAALSHHHAVGIEHRPWIAREIGEPGLRSLRAMKNVLDPTGILNPGALFPPDSD